MRKILVLLLLSLPLFSSLLRPGFYNSQDSMQHFRIYQMQRCFVDFQIPCRWVPDMGFGYGYPLFIFYAPGPYYLGALIHLFGISIVDSSKILLVGGFILSGLSMYLFLKSTYRKSLPALVGSIIYLYAPVRAVQVYVRGSLSEFLAFAVFPLLFLFSSRLIRLNRWRDSGILALVISAMFLTHNLMSYAIMPVLIVWIVIQLIITKNYSAILKTIISFILGICLAGFFLIPLLVERPLVHLETLTGGYFGYQQHFVNLSRLFFSNSWGYGSSAVSPASELSLSLGPVHWLLSGLAGLLALFYLKRNPKLAILVLTMLVVEIITVFLIHRRSAFIWESLSFLSFFQFPWRFLVISNFLTSFLAASCFVFLSHLKIIKLFAVLTVISLLYLHGHFFQPQKWLSYSDRDMFTPGEFTRLQTISIFDYLPKVAVLPPNSAAGDVPEILSGTGQTLSYVKSSASQSGIIFITSPKAIVRLPLFDYPGMQVKVDGQLVAHSHSDCRFQSYCFGLINFDLTSGSHQITTSFSRTPDRLIGDLLTIICLPLTCILLIVKTKHQA